MMRRSLCLLLFLLIFAAPSAAQPEPKKRFVSDVLMRPVEGELVQVFGQLRVDLGQLYIVEGSSAVRLNPSGDSLAELLLARGRRIEVIGSVRRRVGFAPEIDVLRLGWGGIRGRSQGSSDPQALPEDRTKYGTSKLTGVPVDEVVRHSLKYTRVTVRGVFHEELRQYFLSGSKGDLALSGIEELSDELSRGLGHEVSVDGEIDIELGRKVSLKVLGITLEDGTTVDCFRKGCKQVDKSRYE